MLTWLIALGTRTQPCDAGVLGTSYPPWMAMPWLKYTGLSIPPSRLTRLPSILRDTWNTPIGVFE